MFSDKFFSIVRNKDRLDAVYQKMARILKYHEQKRRTKNALKILFADFSVEERRFIIKTYVQWIRKGTITISELEILMRIGKINEFPVTATMTANRSLT